MAKDNRDKTLDGGREQLTAWQVGDDVEALRTAIGRDPAADLAIAERLGHIASPEAVALLQRLERDSKSKPVRKEAKRSLYRLEQRGVAIERPALAPPRLPEVEPALTGYLSIVDGNGDQLIWLVRTVPGGILHAFAALNDPEGLREIELAENTKRGLRALREDLMSKHEIRLVEADWRYCDFAIDRALRWARERGQSGGDYPGIRARLTREPVQECDEPIYGVLDAAAIEADASLLERSHEVLQQPEMRTWVLRPEQLQAYVEEWLEIRNSPLVLSEEAQQERIGELSQKAVVELYGGEMQPSWVRRLETLAYVFHKTGRVDAAKSTFAAALALAKSAEGGKDVPLIEALTRSCLAFYAHVAEQQRAEEKKSSLIVTPEDAAREASERKGEG